MTTKGGDAKPYRGRREWRRTQLREAGAPALAAGQPQSPADPEALDGGEGEPPHYHGHRARRVIVNEDDRRRRQFQCASHHLARVDRRMIDGAEPLNLVGD